MADEETDQKYDADRFESTSFTCVTEHTTYRGRNHSHVDYEWSNLRLG